jgi:hypothetical protein
MGVRDAHRGEVISIEVGVLVVMAEEVVEGERDKELETMVLGLGFRTD